MDIYWLRVTALWTHGAPDLGGRHHRDSSYLTLSTAPTFLQENWISTSSDEFLKNATIWENTLVIYFILHTSSLNSPWCPQSPYHDPSGSSVVSAGLFCSWVVAVPVLGLRASLSFHASGHHTEERSSLYFSVCTERKIVPFEESMGLIVQDPLHDSWKQRMWWHYRGGTQVLPACSSELWLPGAPALQPQWSQTVPVIWQRKAGCFSVYCLEGVRRITFGCHTTNFGTGLKLSWQK